VRLEEARQERLLQRLSVHVARGRKAVERQDGRAMSRTRRKPMSTPRGVSAGHDEDTDRRVPVGGVPLSIAESLCGGRLLSDLKP